MKLHEWSERHGIDVRWKDEARWIPDTFTSEETRAELWRLSDYAVSSVAGGTIWLRRLPPARVIVVEVSGGVVQAVHDIPPGVVVEVRDFDVDGCDEEDGVETDADGERFVREVYEAGA